MMIGLACLALGLLVGYSIPRGGEIAARGAGTAADRRAASDAPAAKTANSKSTGTFTPARSTTGNKPDLAANRARQSLPSANDPQARHQWAQNLSPNEIPSLVAGLCADLGPDGLEHEDRNLIDSAVRAWWEKDSTGLLAWLNQLPKGGTKRYLVSSFLKQLSYNDRARATALAESFKAQDPEWNDSELQDRFIKSDVEEAWKRSTVTADEMLQLYSRFSRGNRTTGQRVGVYPLNFDFRKFLDGMAALNQEHGKNISEIPSDTLEAWAKVDPQSAVQWLVESQPDGQHWRGLSFADWEDIASGIAATSGPQAYHQWAADIVAQPQQGKLRELILQRSSDPDLIGILEYIGNTAQRDEVLAAAVGSSNRWRSEDDIEKLALISTPEARLRVIVQNPDRFQSWIKRGKADPSFWPRAGLTTEQVAAVLPDAPRR